MRKFLLTGLTCAASTLALSSAAMAQNAMERTFTGPYIGVQGGYTIAEDEVGGTDLDVDGGNYGVFAGFQADTLLDKTVNQTGLGLTGAIEAHYNWSDADDSVGGIELEKNHDWGISFRPGLTILDDNMPFGVSPYGILGYRRAEFEANTALGSTEEDFDGFELGIGTQLIAYEHIGIRAEYSHTWYEEEGGIDPNEHNLRLGAAYHF
jgi:outer membrane immunogenic protein